MLIKNVYAIYTRFPIVDPSGHCATDFQSCYAFEVLFGLLELPMFTCTRFLIKEL